MAKSKYGNIEAPAVMPLTPSNDADNIVTLSDLFARPITDMPCLFGPVILKCGLAVLVGGSDCGKSSLLRQMAMCVATGRDFLGWAYGGVYHRAIYVSTEDDATLTARVVQKYNRTMQLSDEAAKRLRFVFDTDGQPLDELLDSMMQEQPADLVVIDAFGDAFDGKNLNDNSEVRKFYAKYKSIAAKYNALIVFNHHTGKRTDMLAVSKANTLGSQAIEAAPRLAMELRQDPNDPDTKHLCITKANYLPNVYKCESYAIRMDDNLVFAPTGARAAFESLSKTDGGKRNRQYSDTEHKDLLRVAFNGEEVVNQSAILSAIIASLQVTRKTAYYAHLQRYIKDGWITEVPSGKPNLKNYRLTL